MNMYGEAGIFYGRLVDRYLDESGDRILVVRSGGAIFRVYVPPQHEYAPRRAGTEVFFTRNGDSGREYKFLSDFEVDQMFDSFFAERDIKLQCGN